MKSCNLLFISTVLFTVLIFGCTRKPSSDCEGCIISVNPQQTERLEPVDCCHKFELLDAGIPIQLGYITNAWIQDQKWIIIQIRVLIFSTLTATCFPNYREKGGPPMNISPYGTLGPKTTRFAYSIPTDKKFFDTISMAISSPPLRSKDHTEKPFNICTH